MANPEDFYTLRSAPGGNAVPGMETFEATPRRIQNPNITPGAASVEAQQFRNSLRANPVTATPQLQPQAAGTSALRSGVALPVGAALAATLGPRAMVNVGNPADTPGPARQESPLVAQIPTSGYQRAPAATPYNMWTDTEVGRNVGNALAAAPGLGGGAALARGAGAITRAVNTADGLAQATGAGVLAAREGAPRTQPTAPLSATPTAPLSATPTAESVTPNGTDARLANGTAGTLAPSAPVNGIRRIDTPGQSPMFTNVPDGGQFGNDTLAARGPVSAQNMAAADALAARQTQASQGATLRSQPGFSGVIGSASMMQRTPEQQRRDAEVQATSIHKPTAARGAASLKSLDEREAAAAREAGALQRAATQAAASMYGADQSLRGNMYGAEQERMSRTAVAEQNARSAKATSEYDQFNKDRSYALDKERFGTEVAEKNRSSRAADSKAVDESLQGMFRTRDKDGKDVADTAKVGQYKQALQTTIGALIEQHEASGDPKRVAIAKTLRERGMAAIDPQEHAELKRLFDTRDRARQSTGYMRGGANLVDSDNLLDFQQRPTNGVESRVVGGDRVRLRGGTDMSINDLRYTEPANAVLPDWFKTRDNDLTRGLRMN